MGLFQVFNEGGVVVRPLLLLLRTFLHLYSCEGGRSHVFLMRDRAGERKGKGGRAHG